METNTPPMNARDDLYQEAIDLAYMTFSDPSDEHIEAVHQRLLFNQRAGLKAQGAVTLH